MDMVRRRELYAGLTVAFVGAVAAVKGREYGVGTLANMGPGLFPVVLGVAMVGIGGLIAISGPDSEAENSSVPFDIRVWMCLLSGAALFIFLGQYAGLLPAIFFSVLISAWADRTTTLRGSVLLAAGMSVFGAGLFTYVLHVQLPLLIGY